MNFYVYVLQEVKASATAPIKIGVTNHRSRRISQLQNGNPRELLFRASLGPMKKQDAYSLERHFQIELASYHLRGEWYSGKALKKIFKSPRFDAA